MKRPCQNPSKNIAIFWNMKAKWHFSLLMNVLVYMLKYDQSIHQGKIKKKKEHQHTRTSNQQKYFQCKHALSTSHKNNNSNAQKLFDRQAQCNSFFLCGFVVCTIPPNNPLPRELIISKKHLLSVAHLSISLEQI